MEGFVWTVLYGLFFGRVCLEGCVWTVLFGLFCLDGFVWTGLFGPRQYSEVGRIAYLRQTQHLVWIEIT